MSKISEFKVSYCYCYLIFICAFCHLSRAISLSFSDSLSCSVFASALGDRLGVPFSSFVSNFDGSLGGLCVVVDACQILTLYTLKIICQENFKKFKVLML